MYSSSRGELAAIVLVLARVGGDPAILPISPEATRADTARARHILGLDRPIYRQYVACLTSLARGDFGNSFRQNQPALTIVLQRIFRFWVNVRSETMLALDDQPYGDTM